MRDRETGEVLVETNDELEEVLAGIEMFGTRFQEWDFGWKVTAVPPVEYAGWSGWFIQCSFERPDVEGGKMSRGYGREWYLRAGLSVERVVFTAWLAIRQIVEHELHESFTVNVGGRRVRLLDPHKSLEDVAHGSREV